jgi:LDH2 family malate/lactate/ureidoglycolate dehydrogenase
MCFFFLILGPLFDRFFSLLFITFASLFCFKKVVFSKACDIAIEKARSAGVGIVGTNNTASSTGALAYHAERIAKAGFVAIVTSSCPPMVAPDRSFEPLYGTNPIAFGVPSPQPLVFDMSTAAVTWFSVVEAKTMGMQLPEGVAFDRHGRLTRDPSAVLDGGALRSFDKSYKGSALALMVTVLAGPLVGAGFAGMICV